MIMQAITFSNKRIKCPECNARRGFAPYVGHEREYKGKCHACGLLFIPLFENINTKAVYKPKTAHKQPVKVIAPPVNYVDEQQVLTSQIDLKKDPFAKGLIALGIHKHHLIKWNVGRGENGRTLFFYLNINGKYVNTKEIVYKPDLHRDKTNFPKFLCSKSQGYGQCLYGEWQLQGAKLNTPILLVESEKTAIVASYAMPEKIWIATGGATGLTMDKALVLKGKPVFIVVDSDKAGRSNAGKSQELLKDICRIVKIIDLFPEKDSGQDLADYLICRFNGLSKSISMLSESDLETFEERAGIMEYDGGLSKYEAELKALERI